MKNGFMVAAIAIVMLCSPQSNNLMFAQSQGLVPGGKNSPPPPSKILAKASPPPAKIPLVFPPPAKVPTGKALPPPPSKGVPKAAPPAFKKSPPPLVFKKTPPPSLSKKIPPPLLKKTPPPAKVLPPPPPQPPASYNGKVEMDIVLKKLIFFGYTKFAAALNDTAIKPIVRDSILNFYPVTFFAPPNTAFTSEVMKLLFKSPRNNVKVLLYHIINGRYTFKNLQALKIGSQLKTANYQFPLQKLSNGTVNMLWGTKTSSSYAVITPDFYTDRQISIMATNRVIRPVNLT